MVFENSPLLDIKFTAQINLPILPVCLAKIKQTSGDVADVHELCNLILKIEIRPNLEVNC